MTQHAPLRARAVVPTPLASPPPNRACVHSRPSDLSLPSGEQKLGLVQQLLQRCLGGIERVERILWLGVE